MKTLKFKVFCNKVGNGEKRKTVRKDTDIKAGDRIKLVAIVAADEYSESNYLIGHTTCTLTQEIKIAKNGTIKIDGQTIYTAADFAKKDGFDYLDDFLAYINDKYGLPFNGVVVEWGDLK